MSGTSPSGDETWKNYTNDSEVRVTIDDICFGSSSAIRGQHDPQIAANPRGHCPFAMNRPAQNGSVQRGVQGALDRVFG
jgi:hypothetical protein